MEQRLSIRPMHLQDLDRVRELGAQLGYEVSSAQLAERFDHLSRSPEDELWVADDGQDIRGWLHAQVSRSLEYPAHVELRALVVDATARRLGVGRALVEAAEQWTKLMGFTLVRVRSNVVRNEAHAFYPRLGFELAKTSHLYMRHLA